MDAHFFRRIARSLAARLRGSRLERIHQPLARVTAFSVFTAAGRKECLFLRAERKEPLLFIAKKNPFPNPAFPPALIMRLRKHCEGRRLGESRLDWIGRRLAFALPGENGSRAGWLLLDIKTGPDFLAELPESFAAEPQWPPLAALTESGLAAPSRNADENALWRRYPMLTPSLRRTLTLLDDQEKAALLVDLEAGNGDLFFYTRETEPPLLSAWPLPPALRPEGGEERLVGDDEVCMLAALRAAQLPLLLAGESESRQARTEKPRQAANMRRNRLIAALNEEQKRLTANCALREDALLLQANLWRFASDARLESVTLDGRVLPLNHFLTVSENTQALFKLSARAARGLAMLKKRLAALDETEPPAPCFRPETKASEKNPSPEKQASAFKGIQKFRSSDGFTLWRGRNAEGNRRALKLAHPFDLWFHTEDGPSAHLILRRDHGEQNVPERTLLEAAALTALKSRYKDDVKAPVMAALAKHVSPVKGGAPGAVRVQAVWRAFLVAPDPALENALAGIS